jgi:hypothetical protein
MAKHVINVINVTGIRTAALWVTPSQSFVSTPEPFLFLFLFLFVLSDLKLRRKKRRWSNEEEGFKTILW